jgi:hypothetical protein
MNKSVSKEEARIAMWRAGNLNYKLHPAQKKMRANFASSTGRIYTLNCARQLGKSFFLCTLAIETALKTPYSRVAFCAPTSRMTRQIIIPAFREILKDCPEDIRPVWFAQEQRFVFQNGSVIDVAGSESGNADRLRGTKADLAVIDEAAFISDLEYVTKDVMAPMLLTTRGRILMASTPSPMPRHPFETYCLKAIETGNYSHFTINDNPMIAKNEIAEWCDLAGGVESTTWRREYLAEFVVEAELVVIPEFTAEKQAKAVREYDRPTHFDSYVSLDPGGRDLTASLFGYYDFINNKYIIEDEVVLENSRTDILATAIKAKENELWLEKKPYFRVCDADPTLINDLDDIYGLRFITTDRDNKEACINDLRVIIQQDRLVISPKCKILISHLRSAIWDAKREKFARITGFGHFDTIDALIYFIRNVRKGHNPFPIDQGLRGPNVHTWDIERPKTPTAKIFERMFLPPKISK